MVWAEVDAEVEAAAEGGPSVPEADGGAGERVDGGAGEALIILDLFSCDQLAHSGLRKRVGSV